MKFLRLIVGGLLSLICGLAIGAFIMLATLQASVLNENTAKKWVADSGIYNRALETFLAFQDQEESGIINAEVSKAALQLTFPPDYIKEQTEFAGSKIYSWLHGNSDTLAFTIAVHEKRTEFINNLARGIEPEVKKLPHCTNSSDVSQSSQCLPPGVTATAFARQIARSSVENGKTLEGPITNRDLGSASIPDNGSPEIQAFTKNVDIYIWFAVATAFITGLLRVLVANKKLKAAIKISRSNAFSAIFLATLGLLAFLFGANIQIAPAVSATEPGQDLMLKNVIDPLLQQAIPGAGFILMIVSLVVTVICTIIWIICSIIRHRHNKSQTVDDLMQQASVPTKSTPSKHQQSTPVVSEVPPTPTPPSAPLSRKPPIIQ